MRTIKKYASTLPIVALCVLVLGSAVALSQKKFMMLRSGRPAVKVMLSGMVERDDNKVPVEKAALVKSGEILDWTINAENTGNAAALAYKAVGHIPRGTEFVAGSAKADGAKTVFSIDGGKSYSPQPMIEEKQPDGSVKRVPAPSSMYTEVRYEWADPLAQGGKLSATYKVRVK